MFRQFGKVFYLFFLIFLFSSSAWGQENKQTDKQDKSPGAWISLSDQDIILPLTSIEWGIPDRWSFTSRYVHMFEKDRDNKPWLNNLCITLSPGISGGRFAIGYQGIYSPSSGPDLTILSEVRLVLLRTWGNPHSIEADQTFFGAEIRSSFMGWINLGMGYFAQISDSNSAQGQFISFHAGIGI